MSANTTVIEPVTGGVYGDHGTGCIEGDGGLIEGWGGIEIAR